MVALTQARSLTIVINGTTYSQYVAEFSCGFESWQAGSGLILKRGEVSLVSIAGGISLDPRDNADFAPGNTVTVTWDGSPHPIAGTMLITAPPTVSALLSNLPVTSSNIALQIPVGCALSYYKANQPDDDRSGVTMGVNSTLKEVLTSLLEAAGIPSGDLFPAALGAISEIEAATLDFPIEKQGGGFVDLAGELIYSRLAGGFLYCNKSNQVIASILDLDSDLPRTLDLVLGEDDREYIPQLDASVPPGTVRGVGIKNTYESISDFSVVEETLSTTTTTRTRFLKPGSNAVINLSYSDGFPLIIKPPVLQFSAVFNGSLSSVEFRFEIRNGSIPEVIHKQFSDVNIVTVEKSVMSDVSLFVYKQFGITRTVRVENNKSLNAKIYNNGSGLLLLEYNVDFAQAQVIDSFYSTSYAPDALRPSLASYTEYQYSQEGNIKKTIKTEIKLSPLVAPNDSNFSIDPDIAVSRQLSIWKKTTKSWDAEKSGYWKESVLVEQSIGSVDPSFIGNGGNAIYYKLMPIDDTYTKTANDGSTAPPSPEVWGVEAIVKSEITQEANFSQSKQQTIVTVPYAVDDLTVKTIAELEGEIVWGRANQYLIECEYDLDFLYTTTLYPDKWGAPLTKIRVEEPGNIYRIFAADAVQFVHEPAEDYLAFAGIYLGKGTALSTVRDDISAPLIAGNTVGVTLDTIIYGTEYQLNITGDEV